MVKGFPGCLRDKITTISVTTNNFMFVGSKSELKQISIISGEVVKDYDHGSHWTFCIKVRDDGGKGSDAEILFATSAEGAIRQISVNDQKCVKVEMLDSGVNTMAICGEEKYFYYKDPEGSLKQIHIGDFKLVCSYGKVASDVDSCMAI